jgi:membrane peptidoglycan carboxypeptidase
MGSHPGPPPPIDIRRLGAVLAALAAAVAPVLATLWISTPDVSDVQARVVALAKSYGVVMLQPGDVPPTLADAVVATEDERYYSHHGIDTVGLARAVIYDAANV